MTTPFTVSGSPELEHLIARDLDNIVKRVTALPEAANFTGILLLGGYGRGEGTPFKLSPTAKETPYNDYDLVVISHPLNPWERRRIQRSLNHLGEELEKEVGIAVDLYLHTTHSLKHCEWSLLNGEMLWGHRMLWGSEDTLKTMPTFDLTRPPLSEGTRLLMNRGRLLLIAQTKIAQASPLSSADEAICRKYLYKNALAFGDCILIANQAYDLYYQNKIKRIEDFRRDSSIPLIEPIVNAYQSACRFKLYGNAEDLLQGGLHSQFDLIKRIYPQFILWYEGLRLGVSLTSVNDYCNQLTKAQSDKKLKSLVLNMLLINWKMFRPNPAWAFIHPRQRLPPAICYLLDNSPNSQQRAAELLGCNAQPKALLQRFQSLAERLA